MKLLIDIPEDLNNKIKITKAVNNVTGRQDVVLAILREFYKDNDGAVQLPKPGKRGAK
jgi:hypothetical protein